MFSIQPETGCVVVKFFRQPVIERMASLAIIFPLFPELSGMGILMAVFTTFTQPGKLLEDTAAALLKMALPASGCFMPSLQSEPGLVMIKGNFIPGFNGVALHAVTFRVIGGIQEILVDIFMAIGTTFATYRKVPFAFGLVAVGAGCSPVGTVENKAGRIMLFNAVGRR
jgi:hypothetical protein